MLKQEHLEQHSLVQTARSSALWQAPQDHIGFGSQNQDDDTL